MKVAQITQSYYPRTGGVTEHVDHVTRELRRRGHEVTVVTTNFRDPAPCENGVIRLGRNVLVPMNGAWVNTTAGWNLHRDLVRTFNALRPDVIHTHCPMAPSLPLLTLLAAPPSARVVGTFHMAADGNLGYRLFRGILRRVGKRLDKRIAVSATARQLAKYYFPGEYTIVPNGVDCERFATTHRPIERFKDDALNILFVGRLDKRKGLKYLFEALRMAAPRTDRRLRLLLVGDDGPRRHLLPRIDPDVEVVFTGVVDKDLLPRYFATGDVFCSPATDRESFGIVLLEAMASGVPIVATSIPGYLTVLRHESNSLVVPPKDPTSLCNAIVRLFEDEHLRWRLRNGALDFVQSYRWDRVVDQLEAVYGEGHTVDTTWQKAQSGVVRASVQAGTQKA